MKVNFSYVLPIIFTLGCIALVVAYATDRNGRAYKPESCDHVTVKEILSLDYRDATILLSNGKRMNVNQATLKPGDSICAPVDGS